MTEEEILANSLSTAIEVNKKSLLKKTTDIGVHELYGDSVEMAEHISYHAVKGVFPEKLFKERSPNETEKEHKYIRDNYKQLTLPVFVDYLSTITRPFGDGNWSIEYKEDSKEYKESGNDFKTYVETGVPIYGSLENFVKFILPSIKSIDANGFLSVRPKQISYKEVDGQEVVDSSELYEPTIYYFDSKSVIDYSPNEYYLFLSKEKSEVIFSGQKQKTGVVFELYTRNTVYFIVQYGKKSDNTFKTEIFYQHDLDECPVKQLMGIPTLKGDQILWQSPFLYSVDLLDLVTTNGNWLQAMINSSVFPVKVMFGSPCEFKDSEGFQCIEGTIADHQGNKKTCSQCNGIGLKSRISPLGTLLLNPTTKFVTGEEKATQDPLKYVSPEVHTLEFIDEKVKNDEQKARTILHLRTRNQGTTVNTKNDNTTATEIYDDSKSMTAFVKPISDQIFSIYEWALTLIGKIRYGDSFQAPSLTYPKTFDFKTPEDYLIDISNAIKNNLPPSFIQTILLQYINAFYGDNPKSTSIFKLVMSADRLFGLSQDEINMQLARGTIAKWESILHTSILNFINDSATKDQKFFEKSIADQIKAVQEMAKQKEAEIGGSAASIYDVNV